MRCRATRCAATGAITLADQPETLADLFLGIVSSAPARLASFGLVPADTDADRRVEAAVRLFLRALRL
jgi:hypothetical protein